MKDIDSIISEDLTYQQGFSSNMDWTSKSVPSMVSLSDVLRMSNTVGGGTTGSSINYPNELANIRDFIVKIINDTGETLNRFKQTLKNPIISGDSLKSHIVKLNIKRLEKVVELYTELGKDLEHLELDQ